MKRLTKKDNNHNELTRVFRLAGCTVQDLHMVGSGCPDMIVGINGYNILVEVKNGSFCPSARKLTGFEEIFHRDWRGQVCIIETVEQALALVAAARRLPPLQITH